MEQTMVQLQKELKLTRIFCMITSALMIFLLVGGFLVMGKMDEYIKDIEPLVQELSAVDFLAVSDSLQELKTAMTSVDWERVSEQVSSLDVEALNAAVEGLDTEELTKTLENVNEAVATLEKASDSIKAFMGKFGL